MRDKSLRVAMVGRTFLDMLREPTLCGGINHVIEVYKEFASRYEPVILETLERNGTLIEKTRAGYLLAEVCGLKNHVFDNWAKKVQRGGSRKLDPHGEYSPKYSEKWCLSQHRVSLTIGTM